MVSLYINGSSYRECPRVFAQATRSLDYRIGYDMDMYCNRNMLCVDLLPAIKKSCRFLMWINDAPANVPILDRYAPRATERNTFFLMPHPEPPKIVPARRKFSLRSFMSRKKNTMRLPTPIASPAPLRNIASANITVRRNQTPPSRRRLENIIKNLQRQQERSRVN